MRAPLFITSCSLFAALGACGGSPLATHTSADAAQSVPAQALAGTNACAGCLDDSDCDDGAACAQVFGDNYCVRRCASDLTCAESELCTPAAATDGTPLAVCQSSASPCAIVTPSPLPARPTGDTFAGNANPEVTDGVISAGGGTLSLLHFALVGDTRPPHVDDTAAYPTAVITRIWQDIDAESPRPPFAITTGDYQYTRSGKGEVQKQFDLYLGARAGFRNTVFYAMGNHECAGWTYTNCGPQGDYGETENFLTFKTRMLGAIGQDMPYYRLRIDADDGSWTAKLVFIAPNYWNDVQAAWLDQALQEQTTYTFIVRHEGSYVLYSPGVHATNEILDRHPYTLVLAGHRHTFSYDAGEREVISGTGGAPLATSINYGYVMVKQRLDGAIGLTAYDYDTHAVVQSFAVWADGSVAPSE